VIIFLNTTKLYMWNIYELVTFGEQMKRFLHSTCTNLTFT